MPVVNSKIIKESGLRSRSIDHRASFELRFEACFTKKGHLIVFINFPGRMWPRFAYSWRRCRIFTIHRARKLTWINITIRTTQAPSCCVHREPKTSFNRTYFLRGQNVGEVIVFQYFSRIRTLIFSLSVGFRGKTREYYKYFVCLGPYLCLETVAKGTLRKLLWC